MEIKIKFLRENIKAPSYGRPGDAALDLFSDEEKTLEPGERHVFELGFAMEYPHEYAGIIMDKGGLSAVHGLHTIGGVFDSGYRGEYNVNLINLSDKSITLEKGQKIAQLAILPIARAELTVADKLSETDRGDGRHGSTGKF